MGFHVLLASPETWALVIACRGLGLLVRLALVLGQQTLQVARQL